MDGETRAQKYNGRDGGFGNVAGVEYGHQPVDWKRSKPDWYIGVLQHPGSNEWRQAQKECGECTSQTECSFTCFGCKLHDADC